MGPWFRSDLSPCFPDCSARAPKLTAIGLYGQLAYTVGHRTSKIGVRMAVGASRSDIARMVVVDALAMVLAGLVIGAPIALWGRTFAASSIQDLRAQSAVSIILGASVMVAIAVLAA